jgi:hypothetical protein
LLRFIPQNLVACLLGLRWFGVGVVVEAWCLEQKCLMLAPPFELPDALLSLWLLYGGLWMVAGVVFVVCAWLRWLLGRWWGLALWPLEMSLWPEAPFLLSFGWHSVCVLSSS